MLNNLFDRILVVSLERAATRRTQILEQFRQYGITNFEIVEAVDGLSINKDALIRSGAVVDPPKPLGRGEIACVYSHRKAWQLVWNNYRNALICEDDIVFRPDSAQTMFWSYQHVPCNWDIIHFWSYHHPKRKKINRYVEVAKFEYAGAMCYAITRACARFLLQKSDPITCVLDKTTAQVTAAGSPYKGYVTANVFDHDNSAHSYIGEFGR